MAIEKKAKRLWVYLSEEDATRLDRLVNALGSLNAITVLTALASSGLKACEEAGNRLPLPLKFQIVEGVPEKPPRPDRAHR
jgi:hypothetical protein